MEKQNKETILSNLNTIKVISANIEKRLKMISNKTINVKITIANINSRKPESVEENMSAMRAIADDFNKDVNEINKMMKTLKEMRDRIDNSVKQVEVVDV